MGRASLRDESGYARRSARLRPSGSPGRACAAKWRSSRATGSGTHSGDWSDRPALHWGGCHWLGPSGFAEHRLPATGDERRARDGARLAGALPNLGPFASCLQAFPSLSLGPARKEEGHNPRAFEIRWEMPRAGDHQQRTSRRRCDPAWAGRLAVGPVRDRPYSDCGRLYATASDLAPVQRPRQDSNVRPADSKRLRTRPTGLSWRSSSASPSSFPPRARLGGGCSARLRRIEELAVLPLT